MRNCGPALYLLAVTAVQAQNRPSEIPKHYEAIAAEETLQPGKAVAVETSNRRPEDPDDPADLSRLRSRVFKALPHISLKLVSEKSSADFVLELEVEPHLRYGMFHYQNLPYVFLTMREARSGRLVYCSYQRAGFFSSATAGLLSNLESVTRHSKNPSGSLEACAELAKRPL